METPSPRPGKSRRKKAPRAHSATTVFKPDALLRPEGPLPIERADELFQRDSSIDSPCVDKQRSPAKMEDASPFSQPTSTSDMASPNDPSHIYGHGCYQKMTLFYGQLAGFIFVSQQLSMIVLAPPVDHWCKPPDVYANLSVEEWKNISIPREDDGSYSKCTQYSLSLSVPANTGRTIIPCSSWDYDKDEYSETLISRWDLVCDHSRLFSVYSAIYMSGAMVAVSFAGLLSDNIGRKPVITSAVFMLVVFGFTACLTQTFISFVMFRAVVSGTSAVLRMMTFIVLFEVTTPELRLFYSTTVRMGTVCGVAFIYLLKQLHPSSTLTQLILMIPVLCLLGCSYMLQESPRWLLATGDYKRAKTVVMWAGRMNGALLSVATERWTHIMKMIKKGESRTSLRMNGSMFDLIRSDTLRERSLILFSCWMSHIIAFYQLYLYINRETSDAVQLLSVIVPSVAVVVAYFLMENVGRRLPFSCSLIAGGGTMFAFLLLWATDIGGIPVYTLIAVEHCVLNISTTIIFVYTAELYPTMLRSAGLSASYLFGRVGSLLLTPLNDVASVTHYGVPFVVVGVLNMVTGALALKLPETRCLLLYESVKDVEQQAKRIKLLDLQTGPIKKSRRKK